MDLDEQRAALELVRDAVRSGRLASAHDVSDGGLACALAECCAASGLGARIDAAALVEEAGSLDARAVRRGPGGRRCSPARPRPLEALRRRADGVAVRRLGTVGGTQLAIEAGGATVTVPVGALRDAHDRALPDLFP